MLEPKIRRAEEIQAVIRGVLLQEWDPLGVKDVPAKQGEYDAYVGRLFRLLSQSHEDEPVLQFLVKAEAEMKTPKAGTARAREGLREVVAKLRELDVYFYGASALDVKRGKRRRYNT